MSRSNIKVAIASLLITILVSTAGAFDEATRAKREAVSVGSVPALAQSSGQYKGHPWQGNRMKSLMARFSRCPA